MWNTTWLIGLPFLWKKIHRATFSGDSTKLNRWEMLNFKVILDDHVTNGLGFLKGDIDT
jgi:hypothetical protein